MTGILYFFAYQILGIFIALRLFQREKLCFTMLMGSILGSISLQWLSVLCSFFLDFTKASHITAIILMLCIVAGVAFYTKGKIAKRTINFQPVQTIREHPVLLLMLPLYLYVVYVLQTHTLPIVDGAMHTGQCTYGDMNMHLGFITSIANQGTFPPEYSILPGTKLAYPFLSDSISSSLYLFGTSLKLSYLIPMYVALLQVFFGMYTLALQIVKKKGKAFLAFTLFFLNGGFGFYYFITNGLTDENFTRIFTAFYETPTNLIDENIRFTNIIVDMLIPQRATLFGFAILFPLLCLIQKAKNDIANKRYFIFAGIVAGALPMIHTHSFMALGLLCIGFLMIELTGNIREKATTEKRAAPSLEKPNYLLRILLTGGTLIFLTVLSALWHSEEKNLSPETVFAIGIAFVAILLVSFAFCLYRGFKKELLHTWGLFLIIVLVLALPQLLFWTFKQASGDGFIRGGFNWANETNTYVMFYFKNLGVTFILLLAGLIFAKRKKLHIVLPALIICGIAEFIVFQPNVYDNNKLLLVAFLFICIFAADFLMDILERFSKPVRIGLLSIVIFLGTISALLTMGREAVSDYELYSKDYVAAAEYVNENTKPNDTFLTATNHNNAIASLTGRNIVCGTGSFLYYHGLDYADADNKVALMYKDAAQREILLKQCDVDYIVLGPNEIYSYEINDTASFDSSYETVFESGDVRIYKVN